MMVTRLASIALLLTAVTACETQPFDPAPISNGNTVADPMPGLPTQNLAESECGLFLWTQKQPRRFVFFSKAGESGALLGLEDTPETLSNSAVSGGLFGQFMTRQTWSRPNGQTLQLDLVPGEILENGQRLGSAKMTLTNSEGWETIVPVLGLRACQP